MNFIKSSDLDTIEYLKTIYKDTCKYVLIDLELNKTLACEIFIPEIPSGTSYLYYFKSSNNISKYKMVDMNNHLTFYVVPGKEDLIGDKIFYKQVYKTDWIISNY
jgi:hypothetical protein